MRLNNQEIKLQNTQYYFTTKAENTHEKYTIKCNELYQCYGSYSTDKINALEYCKNIVSHLQDCYNINVLNYGIHSKNIFQFTYVINADFNGHIITFYITKDSNKIIADKNAIKLLLETLERNENNRYILD